MTAYHALFVLFVLVISLSYFYCRRYIQAKLSRSKRAFKPVQNEVVLPPPAMLTLPEEQIPNPYPPYIGRLCIHDPLRDNRAGYGWMDDSLQKPAKCDGCHFHNEAYHIVEGIFSQPQMIYCLALRTNFSNFVYQIEATLLQGAEIGVVFRQTPGFRYYYFYIRRDGTYGLSWQSGRQSQMLIDGYNSAIRIELGQPNVLAVVANGDKIDLYANHEHLASVTDTRYSYGRIGTGVALDAGTTCDAQFKNVMLWTLDE